ncbi:hypothetical protein EDB84DRAFT_1557685 [Lactarius hengduanensis]|nr:hypothetical protein EDB84DRAFT_1557685 [Lactarius hengduanensis]
MTKYVILLPTRAQDEPVQILAGFISGVIFTHPLELLHMCMPYTVRVQPPQVTVRLAHSALLRRRDPQPIRDTDHPTFHTCSLLKLYHASQPVLSASSCTQALAFRSCTTSLADLDVGALAGTVAQIVSYPFEVVRWRMQVGRRRGGTRKWSYFFDSDFNPAPEVQAGPTAHYSNRRTHRGQYLRQSTSIGFGGQF